MEFESECVCTEVLELLYMVSFDLIEWIFGPRINLGSLSLIKWLDCDSIIFLILFS